MPKKRRPKEATRTTAGAPPFFSLPRSAWWALLAVALVVVATTDDRWVGGVADGRQMIRTAVAIVETGSLGQARDLDFTIPRDGGDAVSRFGMGFSLLQVPAAWLAPKVESARGPASSQFLFLLVPLLGVLAAGWAAARAALLLGGGEAAAAPAALLATLASPLASYAAMEFSEPVQAAALGFALAFALAGAARQDRTGLRLAAAAGFAAGWAVLTKSSLIAVAPWTLVPLLAVADRALLRRRVVAATVGAAPVLAVWLAFELVRFGRPFGGYPDDRFTNNLFDGLWRLTVGPNRGLLLFFPAAILAAVWAWRVLRGGRRSGWPSVAAVWLPPAAMLVIAAPYWGWHGMEGWGPRLIVPGVVLLAPAAAVVLVRWPRRWMWAFVAGSAVLNAAPLLQHPTPVATYIMNCRWPEIPSGSAVGDFPFYARSQTTGGEPTVVPFAVLEREPSASPFVVFPWFRVATAEEPIELRERLLAPPWSGRRPDIVPDLALLSPERIRALAPEPRLGVLGRSLWSRTPNPIPGVYDEALRDQVIRAQQLRQVPLAVDLADKLVRLAPTGEADALMLESLRLAGLRPRAQAYLRSIPRARRSHPKINIVLALFERDAGNPSGARAMLSPVASSLRGTPAQLALTQPPSAWPEDLHSMTTVRRRDALVEGPTGQ